MLNFCQCALKSTNPLEFEPDNYWIGTSSNDVIDEFLGFLTEEDAERMQTLIDGGNIELEINEELNYSDISRHKSEDFWTAAPLHRLPHHCEACRLQEISAPHPE